MAKVMTVAKKTSTVTVLASLVTVCALFAQNLVVLDEPEVDVAPTATVDDSATTVEDDNAWNFIPATTVDSDDSVFSDIESVEYADVEDVEDIEDTPPAVTPPPIIPAVAVSDSGAQSRSTVSDSVSIIEMAALEEIRREAQDKHGADAISQGKAALDKGQFSEAIRNYRDALEYISDRPGSAKLRREAASGLAESHYRQALALQKRGDYRAARTSAQDAQKAGHPKADKLVVTLEAQILNPPTPDDQKIVRRISQPSFVENQRVVRGHLAQAREYYASGEYDLCRQELEIIMRDNPFNKDAIIMLQRVGVRRYDVAEAEAEATRREMIYNVKDTWTPKSYANTLMKINTDRGGTTNIVDTPDAVRIQEKMARITIPEVNFRQANLVDVINFLSDASREYDDTKDLDKRGVNIMLAFPANTGATSPANADPFAPAPDISDSGASSLITLQARYVTLQNALEAVMNFAGLKYRINGTIVMVMPLNAPEGILIHRTYNVLPTVVERAVSAKQDNTGGGGFGSGGSMSSGEIVSMTDWKELFKGLGVAWPDGSTIQYMPAIGKLVVVNTAENLSRLESALSILNVIPKQVEIEARFVEVSQDDLESLGFEWYFHNRGGVAGDKAVMSSSAQSEINAGHGYSVAGSSSPTTGFDFLQQRPISGSLLTDGAAAITAILKNTEVEMILHALSSRQNTDVLSAPKVVTKNGQEATIKVVTEYIYPTEYQTDPIMESVTGGGSRQIGAVVTPGSFTMREVGVILQVVPDVTPDGQMINLTMAPQVVDEPTWKDYGSRYPVFQGTPPVLAGWIIIPMEQPFFPVRSVATSIQVYNGSTVVMGGLITERRVTNEDKVPILGDIPLLGRLFRNKYENSQKRNLLIFVTAKLVDPAGRVVRDQVTDIGSLITED